MRILDSGIDCKKSHSSAFCNLQYRVGSIGEDGKDRQACQDRVTTQMIGRCGSDVRGDVIRLHFTADAAGE